MRLVEPFRVVTCFEGGGLGQLFHCRDAQGSDFAVKLPKDWHADSQRLLIEEERRFVRHQGQFVVQYFGQIVHRDGRRGFAMELMDGSLSGLVLNQGALVPKQALNYFHQVVRGLCEVHASAPGAFHGDVKLANVLYKGVTAKLSDFGLARGGLGQTFMVGPHQGGTPGYFPPEGYASQQGDVYSAGVLLWALLAGHEPDLTYGPHIRLELKPALGQLLAEMLEPDPRRRITIHEVLSRLPAFEAETRQVSSWWGVGLGALALLLLVGVASSD